MRVLRPVLAVMESFEFRRLLSGGTITGYVRLDDNSDGTATVPLKDVSVFFDLNGNNQLDTGEPKVFTDGRDTVNGVPNPDLGRYTFGDLPDGNYQVRVQPAHYHRVFAPAANSGTYSVTISSAQTVSGRDFGVYPVAATGGKVFTDTNGNGSYDSGEPLVVGATAYIDLNNNGQLDNGEPTNTTRDYVSYFNQNYNFRDLDPGTYTMRLTNIPAGYSIPTPAFRTSTVAAGEETQNDDFILSNGSGPTPTGRKVDFNLDGKTDLVFRQQASTSFYALNGAQHQSAQSLTGPAAGWELGAAADFDGDGFTDIVYHNNATGASMIQRHVGKPALSGTITLPTVANTQWRIVAAGDFNQDGQNDIVWRNIVTGQNTLWLMNGTTVNVFRALPSTGNQNWSIAGAGDFNGDGIDDLVWRNAADGRNTLWLLNSVQRIQQFKALDVTADQNWKIVGADDFDNDGDVDLYWQNASSGRELLWVYNGINRTAFVNVVVG